MEMAPPSGDPKRRRSNKMSEAMKIQEPTLKAGETASLPDADLSGADLSCANFRSANLMEANLKGANLEGANLSAANLEGAPT